MNNQCYHAKAIAEDLSSPALAEKVVYGLKSATCDRAGDILFDVHIEYISIVLCITNF